MTFDYEPPTELFTAKCEGGRGYAVVTIYWLTRYLSSGCP
jgi:hypothetical protein